MPSRFSLLWQRPIRRSDRVSAAFVGVLLSYILFGFILFGWVLVAIGALTGRLFKSAVESLG